MQYRLRDEQAATRAVAYLMMSGAPFVFGTGVVLTPGRSPLGIAALALVSIFLGLGGAICRWQPDWVPRLYWLAAPFIAIVLVTCLNIGTEDASTGAQMYLLWPVLYSANFLGRATRVVVLLLASVGDAITVFHLLEPSRALSDWFSLTVAMMLTAVLVASLRNRNERLRGVLEAQALADPLTGVANRRSFDDELDRAVAWSHQSGQSIALLTMDVDKFKEINDTWGHAVGDLALQRVSVAVGGVVRGTDDVVARLGGDEFVVLLRTDGVGARRVADQVRSAVATIADLPSGPPGVSIGVALLPDHAGSAEELRASSDAALYEAKLGGRGRTAMAGGSGNGMGRAATGAAQAVR